MEDTFIELVVPKKPSAADTIKKALIIFVVTLFAVGGILLFLPILIIVALLLGFGASFLWKRFNVEYEYTYVNGEIDVAKVFSKQSRKEVAQINLNDAEVIAPLGSHELDNFGSTFKTVDYSAGDPENKPYVIVKGGTKSEKIMLQLNEKMIDDLKRRFPRKVFLY